MTDQAELTAPGNDRASTSIQIRNIDGDDALVSVVSTLNDGLTRAGYDVTLPLVTYNAIRQTSADVAQVIVQQGKASPGNPDGSNVQTATLLYLLQLKHQGGDPLRFITGQPSYELLVQSAEKYVALPHLPLMLAMHGDIAERVNAAQEKYSAAAVAAER